MTVKYLKGNQRAQLFKDDLLVLLMKTMEGAAVLVPHLTMNPPLVLRTRKLNLQAVQLGDLNNLLWRRQAMKKGHHLLFLLV